MTTRPDATPDPAPWTTHRIAARLLGKSQDEIARLAENRSRR
jgi:hypothetical protein